jgi:hypothetical protein
VRAAAERGNRATVNDVPPGASRCARRVDRALSRSDAAMARPRVQAPGTPVDELAHILASNSGQARKLKPRSRPGAIRRAISAASIDRPRAAHRIDDGASPGCAPSNMAAAIVSQRCLGEPPAARDGILPMSALTVHTS